MAVVLRCQHVHVAQEINFNSEGGNSNYAKPIYPKNWAALVLAHMLAASKSSCTKRL